jgi:hypothetical protein
MTKKLTLTMDDKVIRMAKRYAKANGRSVSELVESYFKLIIRPDNGQPVELTPLVKSLMGCFKTSKNFDYKQILRRGKIKDHFQ